MKTKFSKKFISVLLAALMVLTSVPFTAISAFASTSQDATNLSNLISQFEARLDGDKIYVNMQNAYDAYVNANAALDKYKYGDADTSTLLSDAYNSLNSAMNNMTEFTGVVNTPSYSQVNSGDSYYAEAAGLLYNKLLWAETGYSGTERAYAEGPSSTYAQSNLFYPDVTMVYDNSGSQPATTMIVRAYCNKSTSITSASRTRIAINILPTNSNLAVGQSYWGGKIGQNWDATWGILGGTDRINALSSASGYNTAYTFTVRSGRTNYTGDFANYVKYTGTMNDSTAYETITPTVTVFYNSANSYKTDDGENNYLTGNTSYHVINYKRLYNALAAQKSKLDLDANYKEGGASALLGVFDALTSFDVNSYFTSGNGWDACQSAMTTAINTFNTAIASTTATADGTGYQALRDEFDAAAATYATNNIDPDDNTQLYTTTSWNEFTSKYTAAQNIMKLPQGYNNNSGAQTAADELNEARVPAYNPSTGEQTSGLVLYAVRVDTSELEAVIDNAEYALNNSAYFTSASMTQANLASLVTAAKVAVWNGSADNYKTDLKLKASAANQAIVTSQIATLQAAISNLVINADAVVTSATVSGTSYSMNGAISSAKNDYSANDYANYNTTVKPAYEDAENFIAYQLAVDGYTQNSVRQKVTAYINYTKAITTAIRGLELAFSVIPTGTVINAGANETVSGNTENRWSLDFSRPNNGVYFRRSADPATIDLGSVTISWGARDTDNRAAHLDSINIQDSNTDNQGTLFTCGMGWFNGNNDESAATIDFDGNYSVNSFPPSLTASVSGATFRLSNIKGMSYGGDGFGRDMDGNNVTDTTYDFTTALSNVGGQSPPNGALSAKDGTTMVSADYTLTLGRNNAIRELSATTLPTKTVYELSTNISGLYWWRRNQANQGSGGYGRIVIPYTETVTIVDETYLFNLIDESDALQRTNYTNASWNTFKAAIESAKSPMSYSTMTADEIVAESVSRYNTLWTAKNSLHAAASNARLWEVVSNADYVYRSNNRDDYSVETWNAFVTAYNTAKDLVQTGIYSNTNVLNYEATAANQAAIDAYADAVDAAYAGLRSFADFTELDSAITALEARISSGNYTEASLNAVKTALAQIDYVPLNATERRAVISSDAVDASITAAAASVTALQNTLVATSLTASAELDALKETLKVAQISDPDAYDIDRIDAALAQYEVISGTVSIIPDGSYYEAFNATAYAFANDTEANNFISDVITENLQLMSYDVKVVDENNVAQNATYYIVSGSDENETLTALNVTDGKVSVPYGSKVRIYAPDDKDVSWYYGYTSNTGATNITSSNPYGKFFTSDKHINFVVKGNTTFTINAAEESKETVKVTFVRSINNSSTTSYKVDYAELVNSKATVTLEDAPALAFYTFQNFTVDGEVVDGNTIEVTKDTVVVANYTYTGTAITIYIANLASSITTTATVTASYNSQIEISQESLSTVNSQSRGSVIVDGTPVTMTVARGGYAYTKADDIYAYAIVSASDYAKWNNGRKQNAAATGHPAADTEKIVQYGQSYSFRANENVYVIPYTYEELYAANGPINNGIIVDEDENGPYAHIYARDSLVQTDEKLSMICSYVLPQGCTKVELGVLVVAKTDGSPVDGIDLTFNNVGKNGVARLKSSQQINDNQYVVSLLTKSIKETSNVNVKYVAYMIYKDAQGQQHTVTSDAVVAPEVTVTVD